MVYQISIKLPSTWHTKYNGLLSLDGSLFLSEFWSFCGFFSSKNIPALLTWIIILSSFLLLFHYFSGFTNMFTVMKMEAFQKCGGNVFKSNDLTLHCSVNDRGFQEHHKILLTKNIRNKKPRRCNHFIIW